jgi:tRNA threonylcarbamoyladenosine biosynthesis protein TsaE
MALERAWLALECEGEERTELLGRLLAERLVAGDVVALDGELGAGKTCFVRGLAEGLGAHGPVSSPTFTLMHEYEGPLTLRHLDAWMAERGESYLRDGGADWLRGDGVCAVEWAERIASWLPAERFEVRLEHCGPAARLARLRWTGANERLDGLEARFRAESSLGR